MAIYKISELINKLSELSIDGFEYIDVFESEEDDELPAYLAFEGITDTCGGVGYGDVDSCKLPDEYDMDTFCRKVKAGDFCFSLPFTYKEIFTLMHAVDNALEHFKECVDKPENKAIRSEIKQSSVECRNLQAKFKKFAKNFEPL